jgi:imidazolonepropionase-like amidohydrolase
VEFSECNKFQQNFAKGDIVMLALINVTGFDGQGNKLENATVLIENGKFTAIGKNLSIPKGYEVIDASGKVVTPGLIDVHTHLGIHEEGIGSEGHDYNEISSPATPEARALDGINPREKGFEDARLLV